MNELYFFQIRSSYKMYRKKKRSSEGKNIHGKRHLETLAIRYTLFHQYHNGLPTVWAMTIDHMWTAVVIKDCSPAWTSLHMVLHVGIEHMMQITRTVLILLAKCHLLIFQTLNILFDNSEGCCVVTLCHYEGPDWYVVLSGYIVLENNAHCLKRLQLVSTDYFNS